MSLVPYSESDDDTSDSDDDASESDDAASESDDAASESDDARPPRSPLSRSSSAASGAAARAAELQQEQQQQSISRSISQPVAEWDPDSFVKKIMKCTSYVPSADTNGLLYASPPWNFPGMASDGSVVLVFCASLTKQGRTGEQRGTKAKGASQRGIKADEGASPPGTVVMTNTLATVVCARGVRVKCRYAYLSQSSARCVGDCFSGRRMGASGACCARARAARVTALIGANSMRVLTFVGL